MQVSVVTKLIAFAVLARLSCSWGSTGHMVIARIAEIVLAKSDPAVLPKAYETLSSLGHFFKETPNSLLEASVVPDQLSFDFYNFLRNYHTFDAPNVYKNDEPSLPVEPPNAYNIKFAYSSAINIIMDSQDEERQKTATVKKGLVDSLMLRYLLHVTGDAHQPMHATNFFSKVLNNGAWANGDENGINIPVVDVFGKGIKSLHYLWDVCFGLYDSIKDLPLDDKNRAIIEAKTAALMAAFPRDSFRDEVEVIDVEKWIAESTDIAVSFAYSDIDLLPMLTPQYIAMGRSICLKRIALAGYRLAEILKVLYGARH